MLDKTMRKGLGWGLSHLCPQRRPRPLGAGEKHFEVPAVELPEEASLSCINQMLLCIHHSAHIAASFKVLNEAPDRKKRLCRLLSNGRTELEVVHEPRAPVVLNFIDQGSAAWPCRCHAHYNQGLRVLAWCDQMFVHLDFFYYAAELFPCVLFDNTVKD